MGFFMGNEGDNTLIGTEASDHLSGCGGNDLFLAGEGDDEIEAGDGNDTIYGGDGNDMIYGYGGDDAIYAGNGFDTVKAGAGKDTVVGGEGTDQLQGEAGDDSLHGMGGNDVLDGGAGNDVLNGGSGSDTLWGGYGRDQFVIDPNDRAEHVNIGDFNLGGDEDLVDLSAYYNHASMWAHNQANGTDYRNPLDWLRADQTEDGVLTEGFAEIVGPDGTVERVPLNLRLEAARHYSVPADQLTTANTNVQCFTPGTMIEAEGGPVAVEALAVGMRVVTRDRGLQPVRWIGMRNLSRAELGLRPELRPVRIRAGALGAGMPVRDLVVSPWHRMVVASAIAREATGEDEVLVAACNLLDLEGVEVAEDMAEVSYIHFMCDEHEVVFANGAATETLNISASSREMMSENAYAEVIALFPHLAGGVHRLVRQPVRGADGRRLIQRHIEAGCALLAG